MPRTLFLDQTGQLGGAELSLRDIAARYRTNSLVVLFEDGPFRRMLEDDGTPVRVLAQAGRGDAGFGVARSSSLGRGLVGLGRMAPQVTRVARLAREFDLIYANTQKALVVGTIAAAVARRPLVFHLHDLLIPAHFSPANRRASVLLANRATRIIANSAATVESYVAAGGIGERTEVIEYSFEPPSHPVEEQPIDRGARFGVELEPEAYVVGCFSRLSPWKGQHVLIEALTHCSDDVVAVIVGGALFGEDDYAAGLSRQVHDLGLEGRVHFLGFRSDVPRLMAACDLVAHTSNDPEPFGRVIVEAMLSGRPIVATSAGGVLDLVEDGVDGRLSRPGDPHHLAQVIMAGRADLEGSATMAARARERATARFAPEVIAPQIDRVLRQAARTHPRNEVAP
ncbi:MAG: glycosyltransferase family 4 protein [Actinomycetia bacterium]|nr:glycosyltransferase family 4 protein [Actinomycetes bacterium]MCP4224902.1 glycosyltransferase family 4 protein [Actinomycetes bacterium]MCP5031051.1 glycosyltransferase family 4 protein [Actinomycetes bacterium]